MVIVGLIVFGLTYWKDRDILHVNPEAIKNFVVLMILFTFVRFALFSFGAEFGFDINQFNQGASKVRFWQLTLVFLEDASFGIPIYYMIDKLKLSRYIWMPVVAAMSIIFGLGHMYQFEAAFLISLIIPYFVFYEFGRKYGFGTTMICHVLFDMFTLICFKLVPLVI